MLYGLAEGLLDRGVLPFLPEYRLLKNAGEAGISAPVEDVARAWAWVVAYLREQCTAEEGPVLFGGGSAGGHLSLMAWHHHRKYFAGGNAPAGWILGNPVVNTSEEGFGHDLLGRHWQAYAPHLQVESLPAPVLYLQGSADTTTKPVLARSFVDGLRGRGTTVDFRMAEEAEHGFFNAPAYREWTLSQIMDFIDRITNKGRRK